MRTTFLHCEENCHHKKYIMVISVSSHSADLEPPAEEAAVKNK